MKNVRINGNRILKHKFLFKIMFRQRRKAIGLFPSHLHQWLQLPPIFSYIGVIVRFLRLVRLRIFNKRRIFSNVSPKRAAEIRQTNRRYRDRAHTKKYTHTISCTKNKHNEGYEFQVVRKKRLFREHIFGLTS